MNIMETVRNQAAGRWVILFLLAALTGLVGGITGALPVIAAILAPVFVAVFPAAVGVASYFWTVCAEWTKLAVAEKYSEAAYRHMQAAQEDDLRSSLDSIGVEALDELNAAIQRREEDRRNAE